MGVVVVISERRPHGFRGWNRVVPGHQRGSGELATSTWSWGRLVVISALIMAELPDGSGVGPQWHISVAIKNKRPKGTDLRRALRAFGMVRAEEDNHHPGNARHFFMPVDPAKRVDCECKAEDVTMVDADGYRWTNPVDGECRGCEIQPVTGRPCPVHGSAAKEARQ